MRREENNPRYLKRKLLYYNCTLTQPHIIKYFFNTPSVKYTIKHNIAFEMETNCLCDAY